jgi:DNA relaxase NicK
MTNTPAFEILDCGVDWITATCSDRESGQRLLTKASIWMLEERHSGNEQIPWSRHGYEGFQCGAVEIGSRDDSAIVRLSGPTAYRHWAKVMPYATNVSRIDVQLTARWPNNSTQKIAAHYKSALRAKKCREMKRAVSMYRSDDGSCTLYLGKRQSNKFGRIYEKGKESGLDHYKDAVRYELELKNEHADVFARRAVAAESVLAFCAGCVAVYFAGARIRLPTIENNPSTNIRAPTTKSTNETSLRWLAQQVAPVVQRLLQSVPLSVVLERLGLPSSQE